MNESNKKREWIKNVAIIFLAVLLVLTFFSNTIQNYSLPEVAAQYCESGSITNKVRGTGVVNSAEPYSVSIKENRKVASVKAKVGDEVKKGDVLYYLEEGESTDLTEAENALKTAKTAYEDKIIEEGYSLEESKALESDEKGEKSVYQDKASKLVKAKDAAEEAYEKIEDEIEDFKYYTYNKWKDGTSEEAIALDEAIAANEEAVEYWKEIMDDNEEAYKEYSEAYEAYVAAKDAYEKAKSAYEKKKSESNKEKKEKAKKTYQEAKAAYEAVSGSKDKYEAYKTATEAYNSSKSALAANKKAKEDKDKELEVKLIELEDREYALNKEKERTAKELTDFQSDYSGENEIGELYSTYQEAQKSYDKIKEEVTKTEVVSPVSGTILSLAKTAGESVEASEEIATIQLAGKGFTLAFNVTNDQVKYLSVGDEAEVTNSWWYTDVHAKIISIRPDTTDPTAGKVVTFQLEGDVTSGQSLTLTAGKKTANYDYIVPNSAIREDNNGKFILKVDAKSTPLGNRYIAKRVDVTVLAEDETQSAVSGLLEGWEYVITTSSKPIEEGQQVRLKD